MMIRALLLDLDNTLIHNPDRPFAEAYVNSITNYMREAYNLSDVGSTLRLAIKSVAQEKIYDRSLWMRIIEFCAERLNTSFGDFSTAMFHYYTEAFDELSACVQPIVGSRELIETAISNGMDVVIATNPLYPAEAVRKKLSWGELDDHFDNYAYVTHAENMHFTKPHIEYYAETIARVGVEPNTALMVGDSIPNDIAPSQTLGLHTIQSKSDTILILDDVLRASQTAPSPLTQAMVEPQLVGNLGALFGLTDGIVDSFWDQHPDPNEWSPREIVCHLLHSENTVQRPRLERILIEDRPFLPPTQPPPEPFAIPCAETGSQTTQLFAESRMQTVGWLNTLREVDWARPAHHAIFGPTNLLEMAFFTAKHDRLHIEQLCQTLGNCV